MSLTLSRARDRLHWHIIESRGNETQLALPAFYANLFQLLHPTIMRLSRQGWQPTPKGHRSIRFYGTSLVQRETIESFLRDFAQLIALGPNPRLPPSLKQALDFGFALDFNFGSGAGEYTEVGRLEYDAKYQHSTAAIESLAGRLRDALESILPAAFSPLCVSYIGAQRDKKFHLPRELAERLLPRLRNFRRRLIRPAVAHVFLNEDKPSFKNMPVETKAPFWDSMIRCGALELSQSVRGCDVCLLDDLYQSGATMWSFARFFKEQGARRVYGLACVKSLRDTDNL